MKNSWSILAFLFVFITGAFFIDRMSFFDKLKKATQDRTVAGGILNYGAMGKVLKETGLIKAVSDNNFSFPADRLNLSSALLRVSLDSDIDDHLQIFWAKQGQKYSIQQYHDKDLTSGQRTYTFLLPKFDTIHKLRIDPCMGKASVTIRKVTLQQAGRKDMVLTSGNGLDLLKPVNDINDLKYTKNGISFQVIGNDPQLELIVNRSSQQIEKLAFQRKRQKTLINYTANKGQLASFPSAEVITKDHLKKKWSTISIVMDEKDLYHPDTGIIPNKTSRGGQWERPAWFSWYDENGKLRFSSMVGIRIHGGLRLQLYNSFRLYFRKEYGASRFTAFKPKMHFSENTEGVKRLVVHHTSWPEGGWYFNNVLAYDIARRIGCQVPETKLTQLIINGKSKGIFFLAPHIGEQLLTTYFGHDDFIIHKYKSSVNHDAWAFFIDNFWRILSQKDKLSMKEVGKGIDLDNFTRHMFSFVFSGTTDYCQGVAAFDKKKPGSKLFWINWDMDHSFIDYSSSASTRENWEQRSWSLVYRKKHGLCGQSKLFSRLLDDDPEFREYVIDMATDLLNHRLTPSFLNARLEYYNDMLNAYDIKEKKYIHLLQEFIDHRPGFVRRKMQTVFHTGPSWKCSVSGPPGIKYLIDGYPEVAGYQGHYFADSSITVAFTNSHKNNFSHWLVNGKKVFSDPLDIKINAATVIKPVFVDDE